MSCLIQYLYSGATSIMKESFVREILKVTKGVPGMISFAGGMPSPEYFPKETLAELFRNVVLNEGADVLQYGASEGDVILKEVLKDFEDVTYLTDDEIMITVGSTNGIYFFTRSFVDPGDVVICESPGYPGSLTAMEGCGAKCVGIELDEKGMRPDRLKDTLATLIRRGEKVKFIYVIPEFQNPTGKTMDLQRRREIISIAKTYEIPILEDSPYRELRYSGKRLMTLLEIARVEFKDTCLVTIVKSFSKILGPGLRLGFAAGPHEVLHHMVMWAQKSTVSPDCVTQRVAARFIQRGLMKRHIESLAAVYRPKRDRMLEALRRSMPARVKWTFPDGGLFVWLEFPLKVNTDSLLESTLKNNVAFIPGSRFYPEGIEKRNELRLNFSYPSIAEIEKGVEILSCCVREYM